MKKFILGFIAGGIICATITGFATEAWQNITVLPNTIKVVVNGKEVQADNFLYNDTTYLPIRAVSEALGKDVQYDAETSTAIISNETDTVTPEPTMPALSEIPPQATELNPVFSTNYDQSNGLTSDGIPISVDDNGNKYIQTSYIDKVYGYQNKGYYFSQGGFKDSNGQFVLTDIKEINYEVEYEYYETIFRPFIQSLEL